MLTFDELKNFCNTTERRAFGTWRFVKNTLKANTTTLARDCQNRRSYVQSSIAHAALPSSCFALRDDVGSVSASVVRAGDCDSGRCFPRRQPYMPGGRCRQWRLRPPAALLLALPAVARSFAIGVLLVAQPLLDGVLVPAACDERAPSGSVRVAVVSFSLV